jgi:hypothetical protein
VSKHLFSYTIVFTLPHSDRWEYRVTAESATKAISQAKIRAGQDKVPVFECKIEVKR